MVRIDKIIQRKKNKAILFADISGSSALYKQRGNEEAKELVDVLLLSLKNLVLAHKGKVIKTIGDEVMTCFDESSQCLKAAVGMQKCFNGMLKKSELLLSVGIGYGEVLKDNGDLFGEAVNDAAYLTNIAQGGQILLTEEFYQQLPSESQIMVRAFDNIRIKGAKVTTSIYRMFWQEGESQARETQLVSDELTGSDFKQPPLCIEYKDQVILVDKTDTPFVIGRDAEKCDLLIEGSQVSREHCNISFSRGKFVLIDHSTNGCYLTLSGKPEFYLRREEYPLIESTFLSLGLPSAQADGDMLELYY